MTPIFCRLPTIKSHTEITNEELRTIETYVVHLYRKTCNTIDINEARKVVFARDNKQIQNKASDQRSPYAIYIYINQYTKHLNGTKPFKKFIIFVALHYGDGKKKMMCLYPLWTEMPEAASACRELIKCS